MRIGLVSPYSFATPGGVQFHIRDFAAELRSRGHFVEILAPGPPPISKSDADSSAGELVPHLSTAGRAFAVPYNGSVARIAFGPKAAWETKRWLREHDFDLVHVHEPISPSVAMIAAQAAKVPVVATFHSAQTHSRALHLTKGLLRPLLQKFAFRIAVSQEARATIWDHLGFETTVIPNGVTVADFSGRSKPRTAIPNQSEPGATDRDGPTIVFLGRLDESRKGLPVLTAAVPLVLAQVPSAKFLIVGNGTAGQARMEAELGENRRAVTFLGQVTDAEKAELLQAADIYVAPQTGGESFGIVLIEAMSAGTAIVASDLPAFQEVLANGRAGFLFPTGETQALASKILEVWAHPSAAERKCAFAATWVKQYDWPEIATKLEGVYAEVLSRSSR